MQPEKKVSRVFKFSNTWLELVAVLTALYLLSHFFEKEWQQPVRTVEPQISGTEAPEEQWELRLKVHTSGPSLIHRGWRLTWTGMKHIYWRVLPCYIPSFLWEEMICIRSTQTTRLLMSSQHSKSWPSIRGLSKTGLRTSHTTDLISFMS